MITRETLEEFFNDTRTLTQSGDAQFDIDDVCRWSFFFTDSDPVKLVAVAKQLETDGYEYVGLLEPTPDDDDQETIYLRCDRVEQHTVDSLIQRNSEFYALAAEAGLGSYDGMDVGHVDGP